jgi:molecular chaperone Hsp33
MTEHDRLTRFLLPASGIRGVHVSLDATWQEIRGRTPYPEHAQRLLGKACVAAALFTGHTKIDGRLSIQLRADGNLRTLFAECTAAGSLRGIVQLSEGADAPADLRQLGTSAVLAITIENPGLDPREPQRYQSLIALDAADLDEAFENYFRQSEQLPTRLLLAISGDHAAGLFLQKLPAESDDLDGWTRACALFETLTATELLSTSAQLLLHRLFHEESPQLLGDKVLHFACSCSRERVVGMLQSLGEAEARAAAESTGAVEVRCEFCGQNYHFPLTELSVMFKNIKIDLPAPEQLQ